MSFGDETGPARVIRLHPERFGPQPRPCAGLGCASDTTEPGELCKPCREHQAPASAVYLQSTAADAVRRLERLRPSDVPVHLSLPLAQALSDIRRVYDAADPLIHTFQLGAITGEASEFYALPYGEEQRLGPFGRRGHAERALVDYALTHSDWEAE